MKPVEIEFLMKDNLTAGMDKAGQAAGNLADKTAAAAAVIRAKIAEERKMIEEVTADLNRMEKQLSGMKSGPAQTELAAEVAACRKVLEEERATLQGLEKEHRQAEKTLQGVRKEYNEFSHSGEQAATGSQALTDKIREQKEVIRQVEADVKALEKAYKNAAPGNAKLAALDELNAAKKALEEDRNILASYQAEQERTRESSKRLTMQLREMQDTMARMRLSGQQNTEEYRKLAAEAANLSDTLADLNTQTKILSNDDANLQGFMSGVSGLAGIFTTATGALSLFASENENLAKIQTRVQSVMAITMGLQQVMNTLNKDSAFRLVTVVKMKNLLTAANTRLATSLGISTVAAQALMATLTLGLSVVITGLIVAWDKYSDAEERAAEKARELVEIESDGRAQMIKTRFELNETIRSLKEFTGSKQEEKDKVEELNRKYGESFGYYDTLAQWYDVLIEKSEAYVQMLFQQAKVQKLINKAAEADEEVNKLKVMDPEDVEGGHGSIYRFFAKLGAHNIGMTPAEMDAEIDKENRLNKEAKIKAAQERVDDYLKQAEEASRKQAEIAKKNNIGGYVKPKEKKDPKPEKKSQSQAEQKRLAELRKLQLENSQTELDLLKESGEKRRKQVELDYNKEIAAIKEKEKTILKLYDKEGTGDKMFKAFGEGNVDVLARPLIDAAELVKKGWEDAGEGIATVFSSQYGIEDAEGKSHEILITPILPDGTVLSPEELEEYIDTTLNGAEDILAGDSKGLVIKVDASMDGSDGELLHQLQEKFYDVPESVLRELAALYSNALAARNKSLSDITGEESNAETQAMTEYLKRYGTYLQKREALTKDYNARIEKAATEGEKLSLGKELEEALASLDIEKLKREINWSGVFGDLSKVTKKELQEVKKQLIVFKNSKEFRDNATPEQVKVIEEAITNINNAVIDKGGLLGGLADAMSEYEEAVKAVTEAQEELNAALESGDEAAIEAARGKVNTAKANQQNAENNVKKSGDKAVDNLLAIKDAIGQLGDMDTEFSLSQFGNAVGGLVTVLSESGSKVGMIIAGILDLLDMIGDKGLFGVVGNVLGSVSNAVGGIFDSIGSIFGIKGLGGIFKGADYSRYNEMVAQYEELNSVWDELIRKKQEYIDISYGPEAYKVGNEAQELIEKSIASYRILGRERLNAGASAGSHSIGVRQRKGMSGEGWEEARRALGYDFDRYGIGDGRMTGLFDLSVEQLEKLKSEAPTFWAKLDGDVRNYLNSIIDGEARIEDIQNQVREQLTQTSFDKVRDSFVDTLMDMSSDAHDFVDDFNEYFQRAILTTMVNDKFGARLKKWYEDFATMNEDETGITKDEMQQAQSEWEKILADALKERDALKNIMGWTDTTTTTQSGKSGAFTAISQDQGTKLEGMFTSGLNHWVSMDERMEDVADKMGRAENHLAKIEENTGDCKSSLKAIAEDTKKILRDGVKLRS